MEVQELSCLQSVKKKNRDQKTVDTCSMFRSAAELTYCKNTKNATLKNREMNISLWEDESYSVLESCVCVCVCVSQHTYDQSIHENHSVLNRCSCFPSMHLSESNHSALSWLHVSPCCLFPSSASTLCFCLLELDDKSRIEYIWPLRVLYNVLSFLFIFNLWHWERYNRDLATYKWWQ